MANEVADSEVQMARLTASPHRLHSVHGLLRGRVVEGSFEAKDQVYYFRFTPASAAVANGALVLTGRLSIIASSMRTVDHVAARLIAQQGGVGASPIRRQLLSGTAQTSQTATAEQKLEQEKGPETDLQPGLHPFDAPRMDELGRPTVDSTGTFGFAGVLYFQLAPLDARALGVPVDLSKVQLNLRLAPIDNVARDLQNIFSDIAGALLAEVKDERAATGYVEDLNRIFSRQGILTFEPIPPREF
jgi:hypothetical protein